MRARRAIVGLALLAGLTAAGIIAARLIDSDRPAPVPAAAAAATATATATKLPQRTCKERIEGTGPIPFRMREGDIRIGPVIFSALGRATTLRGDGLRPMRGRLPVVKSGVVVLASHVVTMSVAPADRAYARPDYVQGSGGVWKALAPVPPAVRIRACPRDEPAFAYNGPVGESTAFSGGFILSGDGVGRCVTVEVRVKGRSRTYRRAVSFGAGPCS